jgi:hypothetical protein
MEPTGEVHDSTLLEAARTHWRAFMPAWIFPAVFLFGGVASDRMGHPDIFFFAVLPLFFWSFARASGPWRRAEIRYWHGIFWCVAAPFVVWILAIFAHLAMMNR